MISRVKNCVNRLVKYNGNRILEMESLIKENKTLIIRIQK